MESYGSTRSHSTRLSSSAETGQIGVYRRLKLDSRHCGQLSSTRHSIERQFVEPAKAMESIAKPAMANRRLPSGSHWLGNQLGAVAGGRLGFLLLKEDGTLWIWGTNGYSWRDLSNSFPRKLKLDLVTPPVRTGAESNWVEVFTSSDQSAACAKQSDGGILKLSGEWKMEFQNVHLQSTNTSSEWLSFVSQGWADVGVRTNGELWLSLNDWTNNTFAPGGKIQLGQGSKWQIVSFDNYNAVSVIAIRNDGTLWEWPVSYTIQYNPVASNPVQLGNDSDWLTLFRCWPHTVALAADGSLWTWDEPSGHVWLAPSRKPVYLGNIFTAR